MRRLRRGSAAHSKTIRFSSASSATFVREHRDASQNRSLNCFEELVSPWSKNTLSY